MSCLPTYYAQEVTEEQHARMPSIKQARTSVSCWGILTLMMSVYQVLVLFHDTVYAPGSAALLNDDVYITAMCVVQRDAGLFRRPGRWNSVRSPDF